MNKIWVLIISIAILAILNIIGFGMCIKCADENNSSSGQGRFMSILIALNIIGMVVAIAYGVYEMQNTTSKT